MYFQVEMHYKSLNHGDVFVLDDGKVIYCWNGKESSKKERIKVNNIFKLTFGTNFTAVCVCLFVKHIVRPHFLQVNIFTPQGTEVARKIRDEERGGKAKIVVIGNNYSYFFNSLFNLFVIIKVNAMLITFLVAKLASMD